MVSAVTAAAVYLALFFRILSLMREQLYFVPSQQIHGAYLMIKASDRLLIPALLLALLTTTFLIYFPGLFGDFIFDDFINIVNNANSHLSALTFADISKVLRSGIASGITRPLSMLTFGINYYFTNLDPFYFKLTNLIIHLMISVGLYYFAVLLLQLGPRQDSSHKHKLNFIALLAAACWALHPLNVSSVIYVVQRMNQLSVLVTVYALIFYCSFRARDTCSNTQAILAFTAILGMLILGVLFKENAVLLVLYILAIEFFLLDFRVKTDGHRLFLKFVFVFLLMVPAILGLILLVFFPVLILGDYDVRTFTLFERLLTQARVLWIYIGWLLVPDTREFVFFYDNYTASKSLLTPISTLFAVLGLLLLSAFCWVQRKRLPYLCFGICFFFVGHALESTIVALELMFEHRNYLPGFGLLFGCIYTLLHLPPNVLSKKMAKGFLGIFLVFMAFATYDESRKWSNTYSHLVGIASYNPTSYRINYSLGYLYLNLASRTPDNSELFSLASHFYLLATQLNEKAVNAHVGVILADSKNGKTPDPLLVSELERRLRYNRLEAEAFTEISMLTECWYGNFCKFNKATLIGFFNAIAENQATVPTVKQGILDQVGTAIAYLYRNKQDGRALLYLAKAQRDALTIVDLKLIQLEIELLNIDQARNLLAEAQAKPMDAALLAPLQEFDETLKALPATE